MEQTIQFETVIERGVIKIPDQYIEKIPSAVMVTLVPLKRIRIKAGAKSKACCLSADDFTALKIDTRGWKFSREEANERR